MIAIGTRMRSTAHTLTSWFNDRGVKARILAAVLIAGLVGVIVGVVGVAALGSTYDGTTRLYEKNFLGLEDVAALRRATLETRLQVTNQALSLDAATMDAYERTLDEKRAEVEEIAARYGTRELSASKRDALGRFLTGYEDFMAVADAGLLPAGRANDIPEWTRVRDDEAGPVIATMMDALADLVDAEKTDGAGTVTSAASQYSASRTQVVVVLVGGLVVAVLLGVAVARSIVRGLAGARTVADALERGDLTVTADLASRDEVGLMGTALDNAVLRLRGMVSTIDGSAGALASAAEEMSATTTQIASTAEETAAQASVVSSSADQVSRNVETVAAGSEQMGASIQEIASNASRAAEVAQRAVGAAATTSATVNRLGESSREIGNVVKMITSIAEQTNLLALNATIEAARAGEAGKGFAVVAGEVKELAQETARATDDIARRVESIQLDTDGAVAAIADISEIIASINDFQLTIASAVEEQTATTTEMNRSVTDAAAGSGEIATNIAGVAEAAGLTTQGVTESRQAVAALAQMSSELQSLVAQFRTV